MFTLVTGGARSGKSAYALALAESWTERAFIATALAGDAEMRARIEAHRRERGERFHTVEEPRDLAGALGRLPPGTEGVVIDCLTLWLANLEVATAPAEPAASPEVEAFLAYLAAGPETDLVVVTNEIGTGIVPADPATRAFRDLTGRVNQRVAAVADRVVLMVCGLPLVVKGA